VAREGALELLPQRPAGTEDEGLDRADRNVEDLGDLLVRARLDLAHDEGRALIEGDAAERAADLGGRRARLVGHGLLGGVAQVDVLRPCRLLPLALAADLMRDAEQPRARSPLLALDEGAKAFRNVACVTSSASSGLRNRTTA
jgi:hypothetical protein